MRSLVFLAVGVAAALGYGFLFAKTPKVCTNTIRPPRKVIPATLAIAQPVSSAYDPVAMLTQDLAPGHQIFERETADPVWAPAMRAQVSEFITRALGRFPEARLDEIECRLSSCRVVFSSRLADANAAGLSLQKPIVASVFFLGLSEILRGRYSQEAFLLFRPALRPLPAHRQWYERNEARVHGPQTGYAQR